MSSSGTWQTTARNKSGRCVSAAPISKPPLEPPRMARWSLSVYFCEIRNSPAAMKSSKTFCFLSSIPARCQSSPNSAPPRRLASANTPPCSNQRYRSPTKLGVRLMLKPPYPVNRVGFFPLGSSPLLMEDEHRHARAILGVEPELLHFVTCRIDSGSIDFAPERRATTCQVNLINGVWNGERMKRKER